MDRISWRNLSVYVFLYFVASTLIVTISITKEVQGASAGGPLVVISDIIQSSASIFPGDTFNETFVLSNVGNDTAISVLLLMSISSPFALVNSSSNFFVGNLSPNESRYVKVQFSVDDNAAVGVYSLSFNIQYEDFNGLNLDHSGTFGVKIVGSPTLLIGDVKVDPLSLSSGQSGLMTVRLTNVGKDVALDVTMNIFGGSDLLGSSFAYVEKLETKKSQSVLFPVNVAGKVEPATYLLNITASYKDSSNRTYNMSKLFEFKVISTEPFVPYFYLEVAAGVAALALFGYFLYTWKPKNMEGVEQEDKSKSSKRILQVSSKAIVIFCILLIYFLLLIPYTVHLNLGNAGVVIYNEEIALEFLPHGVQELARERGFATPVILLVKHPIQEWTSMVITSKSFSVGTVVEMSDYVVNWRVDWRDFNFAGQAFQRLIIANVKQLDPFESSIETVFSTPQGWILYDVSRVDFYAGPVLVVFALTMLLQKRLALWNIPALVGFYSFQTWRLNTLAYVHRLPVDVELEYFGYLFVAMLPLVLYIWHFERSSGGHFIAEKMKALSHALGLLRE